MIFSYKGKYDILKCNHQCDFVKFKLYTAFTISIFLVLPSLKFNFLLVNQTGNLVLKSKLPPRIEPHP